MKALVKYARGAGHVDVHDVAVREPGSDELLIKIKYCGICGTDLHIRADEYPSDPPVVMGHEYCGTVVQVGTGLGGEWQVGERVVGEVHTGACGRCSLCRIGKPHICVSKLALGSRRDGAFAEYLTLPAWLAHRVPDGVPWEVAAVTEPFAITAHALMERGAITEGSRVLISGSATIGLMATVWARRLGAREIIVAGTHVDTALRFPLAREMGATHVVNVDDGGLSDTVLGRTGNCGVDIWIECSGASSAISSGLELVRKAGRAILIGLVGPEAIPVPWNTILYKELDLVGCFSSPPSSWRLALGAELEEMPKLRKLVTHIISLDEWQQGFTLMRSGEAVKILIDLEA